MAGAKPARPAAIFLWAMALFAAVIALGLITRTGALAPLDKGLSLALALRVNQGQDIWIMLAQWLSWLGRASQRSLIMVAAAVWLLWRKRPRAALVMIITPVLSSITSTVLKELFGRVRPDLIPHLEVISSPAYPSGHATNAASLFILMALLIPGPRPNLTMAACISMALLIGLSRVMLGVHWPSDVIGGWILGSAFALTGAGILQNWEGNR